MLLIREHLLATAAFGVLTLAASLTLSSVAIGQEVTTTASECVDSDGDGWGWDGTMSCQIEDFVATVGECLDLDGDGWGWDGTMSCLVEDDPSAAVCVDTDGDGWGWDGENSCLIEDAVPTSGECVDSDGDGYGWNGVETCLPDDSADGSDDGMDSDSNVTLAELAAGADNFTVLSTALQLTGLDAVLSDDSAAYTVFAPNDQAFELLGEDTIAELISDPDTLQQILLTHVLPGIADSTTALSLVGSTVESASGANLALSVNDESLYVNTSKVIATDIAASNGVVHVLDRVILPRPVTQVSGTIADVAVANGSFNTLVAALQAASLDSLLGDTEANFTVFAPTDDAFAALGDDTIAALLSDVDTLTSILSTHVLVGVSVDSTTALSLTGGSVETASGASVDLSIRGHELFVNNSQIVIADIVTDNGIIHVIDSVIQ